MDGIAATNRKTQTQQQMQRQQKHYLQHTGINGPKNLLLCVAGTCEARQRRDDKVSLKLPLATTIRMKHSLLLLPETLTSVGNAC
jgi:hypothetical protein